MADNLEQTKLDRYAFSLLRSLFYTTLVFVSLALCINFIMHDYLIVKFDTSLLLLNVFLLGLFMFVVFYQSFSWSSKEYYVMPGVIGVKQGILRKNQTEYIVDVNNKVSFNQAGLQRFTDSGDIFYIGEHGNNTLIVFDVKKPKRIMEILLDGNAESIATEEDVKNAEDALMPVIHDTSAPLWQDQTVEQPLEFDTSETPLTGEDTVASNANIESTVLVPPQPELVQNGIQPNATYASDTTVDVERNSLEESDYIDDSISIPYVLEGSTSSVIEAIAVSDDAQEEFEIVIEETDETIEFEEITGEFSLK